MITMSAYPKNEGTRYYGDLTTVQIKLKEKEVLIPNVHNQKSEGLGFEISGLEHVADNNLFIVNRWGKEIFKARKYTNN